MRPVEQISAAAAKPDSTPTAAFVLVGEAVIGR